MPIPVAARSKAWVFGRSPAGVMGSNPSRGHGCLCCVCCIRTIIWNISDVKQEEVFEGTKWIKGTKRTMKEIPPGHGCLSLVSVVCCQVEVSVSG
jgi:hypothetical protein